jgi:hypothetical protein
MLDNDELRIFAQTRFPDLYETTKHYQDREGNEMHMKMFLLKIVL